jgi:pimeloyl-ACP methyl ester carboxylesterase
MVDFAPATSEDTDDQFSITGGQLQIRPYHINYIEAGEGPLVLLLHGWPETARAWRRHLPQFAAAGCRAVAIDQLGYDGSSCPAHIDAYRITSWCVSLRTWSSHSGTRRRRSSGMTGEP